MIESARRARNMKYCYLSIILVGWSTAASSQTCSPSVEARDKRMQEQVLKSARIFTNRALDGLSPAVKSKKAYCSAARHYVRSLDRIVSFYNSTPCLVDRADYWIKKRDDERRDEAECL